MSFILSVADLNRDTVRLIEEGKASLAKEMLDRFLKSNLLSSPSDYLTINSFQNTAGYLAVFEFQAKSGDFSSARQSLMSALSSICLIDDNRESVRDKLWMLYNEIACCAYLVEYFKTYDFYIEKAKLAAINIAEISNANTSLKQIFMEIAHAQNKTSE